MGKVVTSQGLTEFVQEGKFTNVPDHKSKAPNAAAPLETVPEGKTTELAGKEPEKPKEEAKPAEVEAKKPEEAEEGLEEGDKEFPERVKRRIGAKHRAMKEAQESAAEAERFAETQYNERKLAEQRAQALEDRARELEAKVSPAKAVDEPKEPDEADPKYQVNGQFDWKSYTRDVSKFESDKAVADERKRQSDERAAAERKAAEELVRKRFEKVRQDHPDFDRVVESVKGTAADQVPQHLLNYLFESDNGGELHYYLMKHPEETLRISAMKPILGLAELGKLEERLVKPAAPTNGNAAPSKAPERGGAPAPITPLSGEGTTGINTDPSKMTYKELRAYERARERAKH